MNKVYELRKSIQTILKAITTNVYYYSAPDNSSFPQVVFEFSNSVNIGNLETYVLDIDIWDNAQDTTTVETLADSIDDELNKKHLVIDDKLCYACYLDNRLNIRDNDVRLKRKHLTYQVRVYQKNYKQ